MFTILPKIEKTKSKKELSRILNDWIDSLERIKPCKSCEDNPSIDYFDENFDLSWTQDTQLFSKELSDELRFIEKNRFQGKQHYVIVAKKERKAQNIIVQNEVEHQNFSWKNKI